MFISLITDCRDDNALNRQATRYASLFGAPVSTVGVNFYASQGNGELEAAGNLIDALDAGGEQDGVVVVNVAHRDGKGKRWPNGTPFGFFRYKNTLVVSTVDGYCLSLAKKFNLISEFRIVDVATVIDAMIARGNHPKEYRKLVVDSQFRSYEFEPRLAKWVNDGLDLPSEVYPLNQIPDAPSGFWWVDNFGNTVTTLLPEEIGHTAGKKVLTRFGEITCYDRLKDVPNNEPGLIIGSWGIDTRRFICLEIQGENAAKRFGITTGSPLFNTK